MIHRIRLVSKLLVLLVLPMPCFAQGVLVNRHDQQPVRLPRIVVQPDQPSQQYRVKSLAFDVGLDDSVARVQMSQTFVNTGKSTIESEFVFPIPYDGAVEQMTLMVNGKELPAEIMDAAKARAIYESIVRRNRDPALLEWIGTGIIKTSVFPIPPGEERTVLLTYTQVCRRDFGLTDLLLPLRTARYTAAAPDFVRVWVDISSKAPIRNVYSPTHAIGIRQIDAHHARAEIVISGKVPDSDFRMLYDADDSAISARVLSYRPSPGEEGYYMMLMSPDVKAASNGKDAGKSIVFVVDKSGSMSGLKLEQAKSALKFVLNNLRENDRFNIVVYDQTIELFKPEIQAVTSATRAEAIGYVEGLHAGGSTNIDGALEAALKLLPDDKQPAYVMFMTDGLPTAGETNVAKIAVNCTARNTGKARVFAFGVGHDVNSRLLDKLVHDNFGRSEYVRPEENIEAYVSRIYNRIGAPVMTDVDIAFSFDGRKPEDGPPVSRPYPAHVRDIFDGEQIVIVGRYSATGAGKITVQGRIGDTLKSFDFTGEFAAQTSNSAHAYIEKIWAVRRVGDLIDQIDLNGRNDELINELVALSTKHGILTPYTSFLANEEVDFRLTERMRDRTVRELSSLDAESGSAAFEQRKAKGAMMEAKQLADLGGVAGAEADAIVPGARQQQLVHVGGKTFYRQKSLLLDSTVNKEQQDKAIRIKQYSDEWFDLTRCFGTEIGQYLSLDTAICLNFDGKTYLIELAD